MAGREQDLTAAQEQAMGGVSFDRAVYIISVAAELAGVHPQTLRIYERKGLVRPARTAGNTRRYSDRDIERLQLIQELTQERGVNLAGVEMILDLRAQVAALRSRMEDMGRELERNRRRLREEVVGHRRSNVEGQIVPVSSIQRLLRSVLDQPGRFSESR